MQGTILWHMSFVSSPPILQHTAWISTAVHTPGTCMRAWLTNVVKLAAGEQHHSRLPLLYTTGSSGVKWHRMDFVMVSASLEVASLSCGSHLCMSTSSHQFPFHLSHPQKTNHCCSHLIITVLISSLHTIPFFHLFHPPSSKQLLSFLDLH